MQPARASYDRRPQGLFAAEALVVTGREHRDVRLCQSLDDAGEFERRWRRGGAARHGHETGSFDLDKPFAPGARRQAPGRLLGDRVELERAHTCASSSEPTEVTRRRSPT